MPFASYTARRFRNWSAHAVDVQNNLLSSLTSKARLTAFGRDHHFESISSYDDFREAVPIRDYEQTKLYIDRILKGEADVLWPGKPVYLSKTSGTTSGIKYIPITQASIHNHINTARNALVMYIAETGNNKFIDGKMIFLSGSPHLNRTGDLPTGRLSGIVNHHVPGYLRRNQMPSYFTNCIEDWEEKLEGIVEETLMEDMTLISGIPPWVQMYYDRLIEKTGKNIIDLFPNLSLFVHGGVNFQPYKAKLENSVGKKIDTIETYPSSEGFLAFQDSQNEEGLLLNINSGIFFEFVLADEIHSDNPKRISLKDVETDVNYAIILNTNAGLWGYSLGDTIRFVSIDPHRLVVTGRVSHFISAFGEHVISEEVEQALMKISTKHGIEIIEFTVAPLVKTKNETPCHEWFIEFANIPGDMDNFASELDEQMQASNIYYKDLIKGSILQPLRIRAMQENAFRNYMKSKGKLGGQNKVPRLANDRVIADELSFWEMKKVRSE